MLLHQTALAVRVDVAQYRQTNNETANCNTGPADHSNLSESSSVALRPLCSLGIQLSVQMNRAVSSCPPAKQRQRGSSEEGAKSSLACLCMDNSVHVSSFGVLSQSLMRQVKNKLSSLSPLTMNHTGSKGKTLFNG